MITLWGVMQLMGISRQPDGQVRTQIQARRPGFSSEFTRYIALFLSSDSDPDAKQRKPPHGESTLLHKP